MFDSVCFILLQMCSPKEIVLQKIFERKATFEIKEIRRFPQTSVNVIGRWTKAVGLEMKDGKSLFSDIVDFGGRRLIIATDPVCNTTQLDIRTEITPRYGEGQ